MLKLNDDKVQSIVTQPTDMRGARQLVTEQYNAELWAMHNDPFWMNNLPAMMGLTRSYTHLLADKLAETIQADSSINQDFSRRLWFDPKVADGDHSTITIMLASADRNVALLTIDAALHTDAKLIAHDLPQMQDMTDDENGPLDEQFISELSQLVKLLYQADFRFKSIQETVVQPIDGLTFQTRYDNTMLLHNIADINQPGELTLTVPLNGAIATDVQVLDENGRDWADLGTVTNENDQYTWETTTIPDSLVGGQVRLEVSVRSFENVPALDELFVIAANNAILMKQGENPSSYVLELPNHQVLTVTINPTDDTLTLHYPDPTVEVIELNQDYPFIGEWLKAVLPMRRAFN